MNILGNIVTARASLLTLALAILPVLSAFGVQVPAGFPDTLTKGFEAVFTVITIFAGMVHLENRPKPVAPPPSSPPADSGGVPPVVITGLILTLLILYGCTGSFEEAQKPRLALSPVPAVDRTECNSIDRAHAGWNGAGKASSVLAGASGLATIPVDNKDARIGLIAGSVALEAFGMFAFVESDAFGNEWASQCSVSVQ